MDATHAALHCRRCGYDLRGIAPDGACPECGLPVLSSLRSVSSFFVTREGLARFRQGLRLLALAALFVVIPLAPAMQIVGLAFGSIGVAALFAARTTDTSTPSRVLRQIAACGWCTAGVALLLTPIVLPRTPIAADAGVALVICAGAFGGGVALALWIGRVGALASVGLRRFGNVIAVLWGIAGIVAAIQLVRMSLIWGHYLISSARPWYLRPLWGLDSLALILLVSSALGMALLCMGVWRALGRAAKMEADLFEPGDPE